MKSFSAWEALCGRARSRARELGEPVVASAVLPLEARESLDADARGAEPLALLERANGHAAAADRSGHSFRFAWERPREDFALAGAGVAARFVAEGERRFHELAERVSSALRHAVTDLNGADEEAFGGAIAAPLAVGGFSFFDRLDPAQWPGFGAAQLVVPSWLAIRARGRTRVVVSASVAPESDPLQVAGELERLGASLRNGHAAHDAAAPAESPHRTDDVEGHRRWLAMVREAVARIRSGGLSKVVLARVVELVGALPAPFRAFRSLRAAYPDCSTFWIDPGHGQSFLGASPERLARLERGTVYLDALAGSAPRGDRPEEDEQNGLRLLHSEKNRGEHDIVVRAILDAVRPLGGVLEKPDAPSLVKLTNVQHLYTPITVRPPEPVSLISLLGRLHPTPAVGGHPRPDALRLIHAKEGFDRGWYAGPVGWVDARGDGEFSVALRSGALHANGARLFTGAGIVADSDPEMEYFETQIKLQPMLNALVHE